MVGRETFSMPLDGLPPMKYLGSVVVSMRSGPLAGRASGILPGQMGICVWPGDGCHVLACALSSGRHVKTTRQRSNRRAERRRLMGNLMCGVVRQRDARGGTST